MSKYGNRKVKAPDGYFDSVKEYHRWGCLRLLERAGKISDLKRQVKYELIPKQDGEKATYYKADFTYYEKQGEEAFDKLFFYRRHILKGNLNVLTFFFAVKFEIRFFQIFFPHAVDK